MTTQRQDKKTRFRTNKYLLSINTYVLLYSLLKMPQADLDIFFIISFQSKVLLLDENVSL